MKKITLFFSLLALVITGLQARAAEPTEFTIVGSSTALFGTTWDLNNKANNMVLIDDNTYKLEKKGVELTGNVEYKVVGDHSWDWSIPQGDGNQTLEITTSGKYDITFVMDLNKRTLTADAELIEQIEPQPVEYTYTIVGDASLLGASWDTNAAANEMVKQEDGTYKLVKNNVTLAVGKYSYKVVGNHDYGVFEYPMGMNNNTISIDKSGEYNVTFTLKLEGPELSAEVELIKEEVIEFEFYTVAGVEALMGADWDVNAEANDMTKQEDGTYTLVKENVELAAGTYDYKVVANHSWGVWELPSSGNQTLAIEKAGKYNVTFTLDITKPELTANAVLIEVVPEPVVDYLLHYGTASSDWQDVTFVAGEGENEGKLVATATFAENTEFGIKHGDTWYAGFANINDDTANDNAYVIHANWCTNIPLNTANDPHEPNLSLKNFLIKQAGTYTFVLTVGENSITMDVEGFPVAPVLGDLNGDGKADVTDVNIIVNMILGKQAKTEAGNLNGDDDVDVTDVNLLVNIILGKSGDTTGEGE